MILQFAAKEHKDTRESTFAPTLSKFTNEIARRRPAPPAGASEEQLAVAIQCAQWAAKQPREGFEEMVRHRNPNEPLFDFLSPGKLEKSKMGRFYTARKDYEKFILKKTAARCAPQAHRYEQSTLFVRGRCLTFACLSQCAIRGQLAGNGHDERHKAQTHAKEETHENTGAQLPCACTMACVCLWRSRCCLTSCGCSVLFCRSSPLPALAASLRRSCRGPKCLGQARNSRQNLQGCCSL